MIYSEIDESISREYVLNDLTSVYAVRVTEHNPWVLERIDMIGRYYVALPSVVIVDFGSEAEFAYQISLVCERHGFEYRYVEDDGVFSAAVARNIGFSYVKTDLVFFNDIDCFSGPDLFLKLVDAANDFDLSKYFDRMVNLPVYHLAEDATEKVNSKLKTDNRALVKLMNNSIFTKRWDDCEFIAPYSNVFLCRTDLFSYIGGYDERFRGHGSEDFEFLIRYSIYSSRYPTPGNFDKDFYAPTRDSYYKDLKRYKGYRRLFEAFCLEAEVYGLRVAHLSHPKPETMAWIKTNDWKRSAFDEATSTYISNKKELVNLDWLPREKTLLALVKHEDHYNYLLPLRVAGYRIECFDANQKDAQVNIIKKIDSGYYDAVCIFNPYMKSHADLYVYFAYAKNSGVQPIVIERGALPESWYYAEDMAYVDKSYDDLDLERVEIRSPEVLETIFKKIHSGSFTLEDSGQYKTTFYKYRLALNAKNNKKIFVPLQLSDDSAVTRFSDGYLDYSSYIENLKQTFEKFPDVIFLVKRHPLSSLNDLGEILPNNVFFCDPEDNVHALIDISDAVICYNSGVGLLALMHEKPVFTVGRSFYSKEKHSLGIAVDFPESAVEKIITQNYEISGEIRKFVSWLIFEKYSFFKSESIIRDFGDRKSHGYKNSKFYAFRYNNFSFETNILSVDYPFSLISYGAGKLNMWLGIEQHSKDIRGNEKAASSKPVEKLSSKSVENANTAASDTDALLKNEKVIASQKESSKNRKLKKFFHSPKRFFSDSKNPVLKKISAVL